MKDFPVQQPARNHKTSAWVWRAACLAGAIWLLTRLPSPRWIVGRPGRCPHGESLRSPYGQFPDNDDPFSFLPCTRELVHPPLDDANAARTWANQFDPNPQHWLWGSNSSQESSGDGADPHAGQGIFLCGYLDVPLDYTNASDPRIVRLAVTKYQVSGLARVDGHGGLSSSAGKKSARTIVINPGGPGGSGTGFTFNSAEKTTARLSQNQYDVLGWDPRGINMSQPALSCYPYNADRDRWALLTFQSLKEVGRPDTHLRLLDSMSDATFQACRDMHGDLPRFVSTAFVVRDLEEIRKALGEDDLTGYLVSYGTHIGQEYAGMFPSSVGRMILDGVVNARDERPLGGFSWHMLHNVTDAWRDGFLRECVDAGPDHCSLAKWTSDQKQPLTLDQLQHRLETFIHSLAEKPVPAYTSSSGPSLINYSQLTLAIFRALYNPFTWKGFAEMLFELEAGNVTLAAEFLEQTRWEYDPTLPCSSSPQKPNWNELTTMVVCSDSYDAPLPENPIDWWQTYWSNLTAKSWIAGDAGLSMVYPCQRFTDYWPRPAEVYRGDFNKTLKGPVVLVSETHDPATPLVGGQRLLAEMGHANARLIVHHGYGHSSRDTSQCTEAALRAYILDGVPPADTETACYADEKPYRYATDKVNATVDQRKHHLAIWAEHMDDMAMLNPRL
ncbi:tap domain-containingprotein [Purpureocillium lavendulum]|uniref:Tap domain-containingprotein n=1 Tax=Purpureocillium lavendulum TaxID=1247861 RepID=A0AB34FHL4_9HYPO|nr:tap domain-containingprotein [Purpureocillium lavendulum]